MKKIICLLPVFALGCSEANSLDQDLVIELVEVMSYRMNPTVLDEDFDTVSALTSEERGNLAGWIGAPNEFDLNLALGNVYRDWREYSLADQYYRISKESDYLINQIVLCNAVLAKNNEIIMEKGKAGFLKPNVLTSLIDDLAIQKTVLENFADLAQQTNDLRVTLVYARLVAALVSQDPQKFKDCVPVFERNVLEPAWLELLEGENSEVYKREIESGGQSYTQSVILKDVLFILSDGLRFLEEVKDQEMEERWRQRMHFLAELSQQHSGITQQWFQDVLAEPAAGTDAAR